MVPAARRDHHTRTGELGEGPVKHTDWDDLPTPVRDAIQRRTGTVQRARTANAGLNSQIALVLETQTGPVFVKGLPTDHAGVVRQRREAMINPHVLPVAPKLLWHAEDAGWNLLAFEYIPSARHADYTPGSPDLPKVVATMNRLRGITCPNLPVKQATQRWSAYLDDGAHTLLAGDTLLHTDFNSLNLLVTESSTWIVDWAWPTRGAAFIDPACFLIRLITHGHTPARAEWWAGRCTGWNQAPPHAIEAFAVASTRLYAEIARDDPQPWKQRLAEAAAQWLAHRKHTRDRPTAVGFQFAGGHGRSPDPAAPLSRRPGGEPAGNPKLGCELLPDIRGPVRFLEGLDPLQERLPHPGLPSP